MNGTSGLREQVAIIAELRWRLFVNGLRTVRGRVDAVSRAFAVLSRVGLVVAVAFMSGVGGFIAAHDEDYWLFAAVLWGVSLIWQIYPLLAATSSVQFDFRNLLRFPLRFSSFVALSVAYGMADPAAVAGTCWLATFALGITIARPLLLLPAIPLLVLCAGMNLVFGRMLLASLDRWLAQRRTREILAVLFILLVVGIQFIGPAIRHWSGSGLVTAREVLLIQRPFPPGVVAAGLTAAAIGAWPQAGLLALAEAGYIVLFGFVLVRRLRAQYLGEDISETARPAAAAPRSVAVSWRIPFLSDQAAAVAEKECRYLLRNPSMMLAFLLAPLLILVVGIAGGGRGLSGLIGRHAELVFPVAVAYVMLLELNVVYNSFGFDGRGIGLLLVAPIEFRRVLAGKNAFLAALMVIEILLAWIGVRIMVGPPRPMIVLATVLCALFLQLIDFSAGNLASLYMPRRLAYGTSRRQQLPGVTKLISLGVQAAGMGICAGLLAVSYWLDRLWVAAAAGLVLVAVTWPWYQWSLARCTRIALEQRETLMAELSKGEK